MPAPPHEVLRGNTDSERRRRDHDDHEVENPVCSGRDGISRCPDAEWCDLCRVEPGHAQPADGEERVEHKQEHRGSDASRLVRVGVGRRAGEHAHRGRHARRAEDHELAAAELLDGEYGDPGREEVFGSVEGGEESAQERRQADSQENRGSVVCDYDLGLVLKHRHSSRIDLWRLCAH